METANSTDKGVGFSALFMVIAILGAFGLAAFGLTHDQTLAAWAFAVAVIGGSLSIASYHLYS